LCVIVHYDVFMVLSITHNRQCKYWNLWKRTYNGNFQIFKYYAQQTLSCIIIIYVFCIVCADGYVIETLLLLSLTIRTIFELCLCVFSWIYL